MKFYIFNIVTMQLLGEYIDLEEAIHARNEFELIDYIYHSTDKNSIWLHKDK